jgi:hypothetical protein
MKKLIFIAALLWTSNAIAQTKIDSLKSAKQKLDSLFLNEIEAPETNQKPKVLHAEPLYIDLIRDLGARKGEKEWNIGTGLQDKRKYDEIHALVEYEFAPIDRLGFEVELPFTFYSFRNRENKSNGPSNHLESIKLATQWTMLVSEKKNLSAALGYIHEFALLDFNQLSGKKLFKGNSYNPFLVVAKRWGSNYHSLIYTGPKFEKEFNQKAEVNYQINYNLHYMVSGTRNFLGIEMNQEIQNGKSILTLRPQMRLGIAHNLMIGIVSAIPIGQPNAGLGSFMRIIYEPGFKGMH